MLIRAVMERGKQQATVLEERASLSRGIPQGCHRGATRVPQGCHRGAPVDAFLAGKLLRGPAWHPMSQANVLFHIPCPHWLLLRDREWPMSQ